MICACCSPQTRAALTSLVQLPPRLPPPFSLPFAELSTFFLKNIKDVLAVLVGLPALLQLVLSPQHAPKHRDPQVTRQHPLRFP